MGQLFGICKKKTHTLIVGTSNSLQQLIQDPYVTIAIQIKIRTKCVIQNVLYYFLTRDVLEKFVNPSMSIISITISSSCYMFISQ